MAELSDWKTHKKVCVQTAANNVDDRSEKDVFKVLIDALRLHEHDVVNFDHAVDEGSVYAGEDSSIKVSRNFLHLATSKPGILRSWRDAEKQKECEAFSESNDEWSLAKKVTKEGIKRKYGVDNMLMQLRMFAEAIYGRTPGGFDSTDTRGMLVKLERGEMANMHTTLVDMNQLFGR
ncbi:hypothetical protein BS50DRAFT_634500 [Corynespora cassiicola Philippines]|uniref:Uncharacterized protein n=1 Tax=Corynespora cassiicola Philippines TaxID=1448308 RepID=A0A2T2NNV1_CORCC|nr:hypothetical protein BS50DRAFT_634500 [Corynespora cassiicola Philippines]